jgi:hypothetical protein
MAGIVTLWPFAIDSATDSIVFIDMIILLKIYLVGLAANMNFLAVEHVRRSISYL